MATWTITKGSEEFSVQQGRGRKLTSCQDLDEAIRFVRSKVGKDDEVVRVESDGYRTVITREVARKGWRR